MVLETPKPWGVCQGLHAGSETRLIERSVLQSAKLDMLSHRSHLTSVKELQDLEFALIGSGLAWVQYSLSMPPFLSFGMLIYLCFYM